MQALVVCHELIRNGIFLYQQNGPVEPTQTLREAGIVRLIPKSLAYSGLLGEHQCPAVEHFIVPISVESTTLSDILTLPLIASCSS
jgi:hypothetical protein